MPSFFGQQKEVALWQDTFFITTATHECKGSSTFSLDKKHRGSFYDRFIFVHIFCKAIGVWFLTTWMGIADFRRLFAMVPIHKYHLYVKGREPRSMKHSKSLLELYTWLCFIDNSKGVEKYCEKSAFTAYFLQCFSILTDQQRLVKIVCLDMVTWTLQEL